MARMIAEAMIKMMIDGVSLDSSLNDVVGGSSGSGSGKHDMLS